MILVHLGFAGLRADLLRLPFGRAAVNARIGHGDRLARQQFFERGARVASMVTRSGRWLLSIWPSKRRLRS
jgi:hypothetical protein